MNIEDIKLELVALQKLDTQNAINYGAKSKSDWFKQIITTEDNDIIAESIDLSTRANVKPEILANYFDDTMPLRIAKEFQRQTLKKSKSI